MSVEIISDFDIRNATSQVIPKSNKSGRIHPRESYKRKQLRSPLNQSHKYSVRKDRSTTLQSPEQQSDYKDEVKNLKNLNHWRSNIKY